MEKDGDRADCIVTSPPYYGLRDYGTPGEIGQEQTVYEYISNLVTVFRAARDVLKDDGTLWLNMGDTYGKGKQLLGVPWRLAFALQDDGWILRQDIIWAKPNPMPEPVNDRCVKAHEYIFLFAKRERYHFDAAAIRTPWKQNPADIKRALSGHEGYEAKHGSEGLNGIKGQPVGDPTAGANKRSVWTVTKKPYKGAHFAVYPVDLIEPCILAGSRPGGTVLDPFLGSGTTAVAAKKNGRQWLGIELNEKYAELHRQRGVA